MPNLYIDGRTYNGIDTLIVRKADGTGFETFTQGQAAPELQAKTVTPSTSQQTITPDSIYDGLSRVTVNAVTASIDSDIIASNIKQGVNILGVTGTLVSGGTPEIYTTTKSSTSNSLSITFTGLSKEPTMFTVISTQQITSPTVRVITSLCRYNNSYQGCCVLNSNRSCYEYVYSSGYTYSYSNGNLTITSPSSTQGYFKSTYRLIAI